MRRALRRILLAATTFTCGGADGGDADGSNGPEITLPVSRTMPTVIGSGLVPATAAASVKHSPTRSLGTSLRQRR
jgi:hypothetical protein